MVGLFHALLLPIWIIIYWNLQPLADFVIDDLFGMASGNHLTETLRFFIFEVPKVMLLLVLIIFGVGILRTYFTPEKTRKILEGKSLIYRKYFSILAWYYYPVLLLFSYSFISWFCRSGCSIGGYFFISDCCPND